jgi:hypothetical protein
MENLPEIQYWMEISGDIQRQYKLPNHEDNDMVGMAVEIAMTIDQTCLRRYSGTILHSDQGTLLSTMMITE